MPKKIDPKVKERCVQQMLDHVAEYPNPTAAALVVAKCNGVGAESVRHWYLQAQIDSGQRRGASSEELAEIKNLKAKIRRLEEDDDILCRASIRSRITWAEIPDSAQNVRYDQAFAFVRKMEESNNQASATD